MSSKGKNFWFKCNHDFFENHKMRCLERSLDFDSKKLPQHEVQNIFSMAMGYVYIKLLAESCTHDGELRLSEKKAYTNRTLSKVIGCPLPFFDYVMDCLKEFEMINIDEQGTITMCDIKKFIGSESEWAEKMREYRGRVKNRLNPPQEASEEVGMSDDTVSEGTPQKPVSARRKKELFWKGNPPTLEYILKTMNDPIRQGSRERIPEDFIREWYDLMCNSGWVDTKLQDCAPIWSTKLAFFWREKKEEYLNKRSAKTASAKQVEDDEEAKFRHNQTLLTESYDD